MGYVLSHAGRYVAVVLGGSGRRDQVIAALSALRRRRRRWSSPTAAVVIAAGGGGHRRLHLLWMSRRRGAFQTRISASLGVMDAALKTAVLAAVARRAPSRFAERPGPLSIAPAAAGPGFGALAHRRTGRARDGG